MALETASDGTITLRQGSGAIFAHLSRRYGVEPTVSDDRIGGSVMMLCWRYERDGVRYAAVASAGLERIPFVGVPPVEVVAEVLEHQAGAAFVVVRTVVERAVQELQSPWEPGRVWINEVPLLNGTRIQALVASESGEGPAVDVIRDEQGAPQAQLQTIALLTASEGRAVAMQGPGPLMHARSTQRAALADVERSADVIAEPVAPEAPAAAPQAEPQAVAPQNPAPLAAPQNPAPLASMPPAPQPIAPAASTAPLRQAGPWEPSRPSANSGTGERRSVGDVPGIAILVSKLVWEAPVSWIECDEHGRLAAFTQTETQAQLDDVNMLEVVSLARVLTLNPWLQEFTLTATSGDFACYDGALGGWVNGRL